MKKLLFLILTIVICSPVFAETVIVEALDNISTINPPDFVKLKILSNITLDDNLTLIKGDIAEFEIVDVKDPKRLKRDANFSVKLLNVHQVDTDKIIKANKEYIGKYTTELNKADLAKTAALAVGNHFIHGISAGFSAIEGAIKNEENNRIKSSAVAVFNSSPVSYVKKGNELTINKEDIFYLKFKTPKDNTEE